MALPLLPFVAGAVIGGLSAYFYRDDRVRRAVRGRADDLSGMVKKTAGEVSDKVSVGFDELKQTLTGKSPGAAPSQKAAPTRAAKKTARKKKVSKKKAAPQKAASSEPETPADE